ncbi:MAG: hypothetical protein OWQ52_02920 [Metallosphaera prunae]|nr:hypothetical protein [Metallosphaera prunae]
MTNGEYYLVDELEFVDHFTSLHLVSTDDYMDVAKLPLERKADLDMKVKDS